MISLCFFPLPPVNRREALRYAGAKAETPELSLLLDAVLADITPHLQGKVCWIDTPIRRQGDILDLGFAKTDSAALARNLVGCDRAVVFAATLGLEFDRVLARYGRVSPAKALLLQGLGAERIEGLCDVFCEKIRQEARKNGRFPAPRFSPGYGDLPLSLQRDIFRVLDCPRKIGLTLNESLLMSPSKSVTAIIGLGHPRESSCSGGCTQCSKTDCIYRSTP